MQKELAKLTKLCNMMKQTETAAFMKKATEKAQPLLTEAVDEIIKAYAAADRMKELLYGLTEHKLIDSAIAEMLGLDMRNYFGRYVDSRSKQFIHTLENLVERPYRETSIVWRELIYDSVCDIEESQNHRLEVCERLLARVQRFYGIDTLQYLYENVDWIVEDIDAIMLYALKLSLDLSMYRTDTKRREEFRVFQNAVRELSQDVLYYLGIHPCALLEIQDGREIYYFVSPDGIGLEDIKTMLTTYSKAKQCEPIIAFRYLFTSASPTKEHPYEFISETIAKQLLLGKKAGIPLVSVHDTIVLNQLTDQ